MSSRRSEMAMRAALLNPHATSSEINTTLQGGPPRPISTMYVRTDLPPALREVAGAEEIPSPLRQTFTAPTDRQLRAIDEASEFAEYAAGPAPSGKHTNIRRNLLSGFRRVAKAVKTAARNEPQRRPPPDAPAHIGPGNITHVHMDGQRASSRFSLYSAGDQSPRGSVLTVATDASQMQAPLTPRQRSLTSQAQFQFQVPQQPQQQQQRVIPQYGDLVRAPTTTSLAGMGRISSASSSAEAVNRYASEPPVKRVSSLSRSPVYGSPATSRIQYTPGPASPRTPGPASPRKIVPNSPLVSTPASPRAIGQTGRWSLGPASPRTPGRASPRVPGMSPDPAGWPLYPVRSDSAAVEEAAAAFPPAGPLSADVVSTFRTQQQQQHDGEAAGPARKRRDRSMTLPSSPRSHQLLRQPRRATRKATMSPSPANAELERLAKNIASRSAAAAAATEPERLTADIRASPLLQPATQDSLGHSAGSRIQRQAVRNLSASSLEEAKASDELMLLPLLLPSPAATTSHPAHSPRLQQVVPGDSPFAPPGLTAPCLSSPTATAADGRSTGVSSGASSDVAIDPMYASVMISEDKLRLYLRQASGSSGSGSGRGSAKSVPLNDSGVHVHERQTARAGSKAYIPRRLAGSASHSTSDIHRHAGLAGYSASLLGIGASASRASLPIAEDRVTSPLCPFSFSHSRFSLINQDGSLNLATYQFDQLEGYQRRLSASGSSAGSPPFPGESSIAERRTRKNTDGGGARTSGWFWSTADPPSALESSNSSASGQGSRQRRLMRKPRKQTGASLAPPKPDVGLGAGLPRLPPPPPLSINVWAAANGASSNCGYPRASASFSGVPERSFSGSSVRSVPVTGLPGLAATRISEGSASGVLPASDSASRRRRPSQQHELSIYPMPEVPVFRRRSGDYPGARAASGGRWPRLMQMAPESVPFDVVYQSTVASMSLGEALTLVEGLGHHGASTASLASSLAAQRPRRRHRRSSSVLTAGELDEVMIRTAEVCHSVQTAIRAQHASESGLGDWIASVLSKQQEQLLIQVAASAAAAAAAAAEEQQQSPDGRASDHASDHARFFSADCSPDTAHELRSTSSGELSTHGAAAAAAAGQSLNMWAAGGYASSGHGTDCVSQESVAAYDLVAAAGVVPGSGHVPP